MRNKLKRFSSNGIKVLLINFIVEEKKILPCTHYTYHSLFICIYCVKSNAIIIILLNPSQTYHFNLKICSYQVAVARPTNL